VGGGGLPGRRPGRARARARLHAHHLAPGHDVRVHGRGRRARDGDVGHVVGGVVGRGGGRRLVAASAGALVQLDGVQVVGAGAARVLVVAVVAVRGRPMAATRAACVGVVAARVPGEVQPLEGHGGGEPPRQGKRCRLPAHVGARRVIVIIVVRFVAGRWLVVASRG